MYTAFTSPYVSQCSRDDSKYMGGCLWVIYKHASILLWGISVKSCLYMEGNRKNLPCLLRDYVVEYYLLCIEK